MELVSAYIENMGVPLIIGARYEFYYFGQLIYGDLQHYDDERYWFENVAYADTEGDIWSGKDFADEKWFFFNMTCVDV
jgi:hypothetical protein